MFYVIVALWLLAIGLNYTFMRVRAEMLKTSCPCVALGGLALAVLLFFMGQNAAAMGVLVAAVYIWAILRWSLFRQSKLAVKVGD